MSKPLSKAASQFRHAISRAKERYGLTLNRDRYRQLCQQIQDGKGTCLGKQSNRLSVWSIVVEDTTGIVRCNVVYDKQRHTICTFLPKDITDAKGVEIPKPYANFPDAINPLTEELDEMFEQMQTPEHREATRRAFNATPAELGRAAVEAAKKQ